MDWSEFFSREAIGSWVSTVLLVLGLFAFRRFATHAIQRRDAPPELLRRWIINTRNTIIAVGVFGVLLIWGTELRAVALSLAAFAVALVVATKELILCLTGGFYRAGLRGLAIGDRIEVAGIRGDIIDKSLLSTTVLEIGPGPTGHRFTGRAVVVPNSLLLTASVISETYMERFTFHQFAVPVAQTDDWSRAEALLLEAATSECAAYSVEAREHMDTLRRAHGLPTIPVEPRVIVQFKGPGQLELIVRVVVPGRHSGEIEEAIVRGYLSGLRAAAKAPDDAPASTS